MAEVATLLNLDETRKWCTAAHGDQRYGQHLYSHHLQNVENVALRFGFDDYVLRKACWAHDVLEDTNHTEEDLLKAGFEQDVVTLAKAVTDEPGTDRHDRKLRTYPKIKNTPHAVLIKLFDRISNVEESIKTNPKKLAKYKTEMNDFSKYLRDEADELAAPLWKHLCSLLE